MLAAWRLAYLLVNEYGAFGLAEKLRNMAGVEEHFPPESQPNILAGILSCVACCSLWASLLMPFMPRYVRTALNAAGGALLIHLLMQELNRIATGLMQEIPDALRDAAEDLKHA